MLINDFNAGINVRGAIAATANWLLAAEVGFNYKSPLSESELVITDAADSEKSLIDVSERYFNYASNNQSQISAAVSVTRAISKKYALQLAVDYSHTSYVDNVNDNTIKTSIKFIF
jgi:hypothetical protein